MNIDKDNFEANLAKIKQDIDESEFVAIDLELSGSTKPSVQSFVNAEEYYELHKCVSSTFQVLQFHGKRGEDNIIRFSADASQFLRNYKFDFNRVFYKGVPYMKKDEEQKITEFWEGYFAKQKDAELNAEDQLFIDGLVNRIGGSIKALEGTTNTFTIGKFVDFDWRQRKFIYQELPKKFPKTVIEKQQIEGHDSLVAKYDINALTGFEKKKKEINGWVGFRHIMDYIANSKKSVVGHNCFLDLLFLTQSFATDLQNKKYDEFKKVVLENFSSIFDTKYFISALVPTLKETGLEKVHKFITCGEFDKIHPNKVNCTLDPSVTYGHAAHEAGYDAYMTGVIFAKQKAVATEKQLADVANCVNLMGCEQSPLTLARDETKIDLSKIFLVTEFPSTFTTDTFQEEKRFGSSIRVKWVNDTTCIIILQANKEKESEPITSVEVEKIAARVSALNDWKVVALHDFDSAETGPLAKKIKVTA